VETEVAGEGEVDNVSAVVKKEYVGGGDQNALMRQ
jgi:hypothetical protein